MDSNHEKKRTIGRKKKEISGSRGEESRNERRTENKINRDEREKQQHVAIESASEGQESNSEGKARREERNREVVIGARACGERDDWPPKAEKRQTLGPWPPDVQIEGPD